MAEPRTTEIEDMPTELMTEPLDWFFAEHYRHRQFCRLVNEVALAHVFDGERVSLLVNFLRYDLPLHIIDEEQDLFPLLRRRALPEDDVENVLGLLSAEHKADAIQAAEVRRILEASLEQQTAPGMEPAARKALQAFAAQELRHLALENAVVLPIARLRLTAKDLTGMSRRLAARRGLVLETATA
ncbi:hemerythrin domain-containing protein [Phenylobacterium kunshanense]|uniref:Hemerythrin domain-containing protein n=1 Tax=Phenylobacterium kunshanense TaxID=1445034 RepID=A0A328BIH7_9CAUL|nr:hemerythrin domain-containing protein [Phenylobacterium kunshanense]RAK66271.1 hemerythrin domain-containing protein [Phenylobacterium kunshanense]